MFWAVGHLHGSRYLSSWILAVHLLRESISWGGGNPAQGANAHAFTPSRWARLCQLADTKRSWTFFLHLFQFVLANMGRGRGERKGMLRLRHESSFLISILGNMQKSWSVPDFHTEHMNPHSLQFPRQLNTMCAQQWNHWHRLLHWPVPTQSGTQSTCLLSYTNLRYLT